MARAKQAAANLSDAARLADALHGLLKQRDCHQTLLSYCDEELIAQSLFHATSEAAKTIPTGSGDTRD